MVCVSLRFLIEIKLGDRCWLVLWVSLFCYFGFLVRRYSVYVSVEVLVLWLVRKKVVILLIVLWLLKVVFVIGFGVVMIFVVRLVGVVLFVIFLVCWVIRLWISFLICLVFFFVWVEWMCSYFGSVISLFRLIMGCVFWWFWNVWNICMVVLFLIGIENSVWKIIFVVIWLVCGFMLIFWLLVSGFSCVMMVLDVVYICGYVLCRWLFLKVRLMMCCCCSYVVLFEMKLELFSSGFSFVVMCGFFGKFIGWCFRIRLISCGLL